MKGYKYQLIIAVIWCIILVTGCSSKSPAVKNSEKNVTKVIAVLPVDNKSPDSKAPQLMRVKILDELYFKGYTKLPLELIDKKLELMYNSEKKNEADIIAPHVIKELVGADAAMYCTITESNRKASFIYAPVTVAAHCELRSTQTGEVLWNAQYKATSRNFDLSGKRLEMKSYEAFETLIEEVVNKVLQTLPAGPNFSG